MSYQIYSKFSIRNGFIIPNFNTRNIPLSHMDVKNQTYFLYSPGQWMCASCHMKLVIEVGMVENN